MDVYDLVALPIYLGIIYFLANLIKGKNSFDPLYREYFIKGLHYKVLGALGYSAIYWFHYKGGDSISFFYTITPTY